MSWVKQHWEESYIDKAEDDILNVVRPAKSTRRQLLIFV